MRLLYAPFGRPTLANGSPTRGPATLAGWVSYVATVTSAARRILGPGGFDLEVWNGVYSDTSFLDAGEHARPGSRRPARAPGGAAGTAVLDSTVAFVRSLRERPFARRGRERRLREPDPAGQRERALRVGLRP